MEGTTTAPTPGRTADPDLKQYTACMPADELEALDKGAKKAHVSRSFAIREGAKLWLRQQARG